MNDLAPRVLAAFGFGGMELIVLLCVAGGLSFWLWMIVDCIQHEKDPGTKVAWVLFIILVGLLGAPLYFFLRKVPRKRT